MKLSSGDRASLSRARSLGDWVRGVVGRWRHLNRLQGINRAEFEQVARDLGLSHPELYGLLTGSNVCAELTEQKLAELGTSTDRIRAAHAPQSQQISSPAQALLPIGPS